MSVIVCTNLARSGDFDPFAGSADADHRWRSGTTGATGVTGGRVVIRSVQPEVADRASIIEMPDRNSGPEKAAREVHSDTGSGFPGIDSRLTASFPRPSVSTGSL